MLIKSLPLFLLSLVLSLVGYAQKNYPEVQLLESGTTTGIRGLSVVNDNVVWASGTTGKVGKSTNGGKNWKWITVKGFENKDFRDIEAFDASTAIVLSIGEPAYILKTTDGGESWKVVYENRTKGMFLDAMDFSNQLYGVVVGDPVDGRFFMAHTFNGGNTWIEMNREDRPKADSGEAFFAASGTNIRCLYNQKTIMVSGGKSSRFFSQGSSSPLPVIQGSETTGANSVAVWDDRSFGAVKRLVVTGGDFSKDSATFKNCYYTYDAGKTWHAPKIPPHGYRSCVEFISKSNLISCGLNGVDYSVDGGKTWRLISSTGFHVCRKARFGTTVYLAGGNGRIAKLSWH